MTFAIYTLFTLTTLTASPFAWTTIKRRRIGRAMSTIDTIEQQILADGKTYTDPAPAAGLFIYTRGGADSIALASSVTAHTTVETIDAAVTTIAAA